MLENLVAFGTCDLLKRINRVALNRGPVFGRASLSVPNRIGIQICLRIDFVGAPGDSSLASRSIGCAGGGEVMDEIPVHPLAPIRIFSEL